MEGFELSCLIEGEMRNGIVRFSYVKKDGTLRFAIGTKDREIAERFGYVPNPTPTGRHINDGEFLLYYDLAANNFRMCSRDRVKDFFGLISEDEVNSDLDLAELCFDK